MAPFRDSGVRPKKGRVLSLFCPKKPINGKKVLGNSVTEFSILELSGAKNPGIFCPLKKKSWNFLNFFFLEFHEKLLFPEFSGPRIFHPAIFCLEIFCPGILFPGKFWHSIKVLGFSAASQQPLLIVSSSPSNLILGEVTQMLCWGYNSPGG